MHILHMSSCEDTNVTEFNWWVSGRWVFASGQLIGPATYMFKFLQHLTDIWNKLTWGNAQQQSFHWINSDLESPTVLAQYCVGAKTKVSVDLSSFELGAGLTQLQDDD